MPMRPCEKCSRNEWNFKHDDGWITATCLNCGGEVRFKAKKRKPVNKNWYEIFRMLEERLTPQDQSDIRIIELRIFKNMAATIGMDELELWFKKRLFRFHNDLVAKRVKIMTKHLKVEDMKINEKNHG